MNKPLSQFWQRLVAPVKEHFSPEILETTAESSKAVLELGKTLEEQGTKLELLKPLVEHSDSLLDVLCSPVAQVMGAGLPFISIAIALLKFYREKTHTEPTLEDCVVLISQAAYLESFAEIIAEHQQLLASWNSQQHSDQALKKALKELDDFELDADAAKRAIASFPESQLVKHFNKVLSARLQQAGLTQPEAEDFTASVARNTEIYFLQALAAARNSVQPLADLYSNGGIEVIKKYGSIQDYLEQEIESKPKENVFSESFTYKDIYVKPQARKIDPNGNINDSSKLIDLENWVKNTLFDKDFNIQRKVIFIQGGPGRGKSIFCRMFADLVRLDLYRRWTPILIRLRDIEVFQPSLEETLRSRLKSKCHFALRDDWLIDPHIRFLFILDGFDELRIERSNNPSVERFIRQVGTFQEDYAQKHRVIITGRAMALHGIDRLPANLERVEIAEMDTELQNQWFNNWRQQFPTDKTTAFQEFLQNAQSCPNQVKELAKEPLLLYMLTAMHRDDKLDISKFEQATGTAAKILVYEQALDWVLTKQRSDSRHPDLNYELTRQNPEALQRILAEAAVCVVQSGGESASMQMVKARLQQDDEAKELIAKAEKELGEESLKTALSAFYLKSNDDGGVEFFHKSFREFLCAERLKQSLEEWTEPGRRGKTFNVDEQQLHWDIYDLFGYGGLTPEIVEYLMGLLVTSAEFRPVELFQRLVSFYLRWCDGEFMDTPPENFPQKKMRLLQEQGIKQGQRQVDIYAGLNVMILLLELQRYAQQRDDLKQQIIFYPSGKPEENSRTNQLLRIINYSDCFHLETFNNVVGQFLSGADLSGTNLSGVDLSDANLSGVDLSDANLSRVNLSGAKLSSAILNGAYLNSAILSEAYLSEAYLDSAYLSRADLSGAILSSADFSQANLSRAYLSDANLSDANLMSANLTSAYLSGANLSDANLSDANLSGAYLSDAILSSANLRGTILSDEFFGDIRWDENTNWENVQGLDTAKNVPEALKQQLGLS